jgi:hypothetical protein
LPFVVDRLRVRAETITAGGGNVDREAAEVDDSEPVRSIASQSFRAVAVGDGVIENARMGQVVGPR